MVFGEGGVSVNEMLGGEDWDDGRGKSVGSLSVQWNFSLFPEPVPGPMAQPYQWKKSWKSES